ncbi:MAG: bifunctional hydroxymethylpyrimidine kinase/phosphomethylpyrimidine kinase, partial [Acidimicrobiales bacterium]
MTPVVALTVAGSDSGGGAGIQADLKTFAALGVFGTSAVTAVTAQHTAAVLGVAVIDPEMVVAQVEAVLDDLPPAAVKTGMLATPGVVGAVARLAAEGRLPNLVVDPVLVSSTGHPLMGEGGVDAYRRLLLPHAAVATPNLREAALLTGRDLADLATTAAMAEAAEELRSLGTGTVVVKGGHLPAAVAGRDPARPGPRAE